ncbi:MAG: DUF4190 domain-containing protein [Sciscionella sp.]
MTTPIAAHPRNGLGTAGFVVGLVGLVLAFIPIIGIVAWPLVIIGLVLSIIGLLRAHKGLASNTGLTIAGIAASAVGLVICIVWAAAFGNAVQQVQHNQLTPAGSAAAPSAAKHTAVFTLSAEKTVNVQYGEIGEEHSDVVHPTAKWTKTFTFGGGSHFLSLSADAVGSNDYTSPITCAITVDGKRLAQQSNPIGVLCDANVNQ